MINYRDIFKRLGWRAVIAGAVLGLGAFVISKGLMLPYWAGAPYFIFGMVIFVVAAIIMGMPLAGVVAEFVSNIFYPSEHYKKPQPVYGIPEAKRAKGLYQEAFDGFQKLSEEHPQVLKAYVEMIDIALVDMENPELASSVYHRGLDNLKEEKARDVLSRRYENLAGGNGQ